MTTYTVSTYGRMPMSVLSFQPFIRKLSDSHLRPVPNDSFYDFRMMGVRYHEAGPCYWEFEGREVGMRGVISPWNFPSITAPNSPNDSFEYLASVLESDVPTPIQEKVKDLLAADKVMNVHSSKMLWHTGDRLTFFLCLKVVHD